MLVLTRKTDEQILIGDDIKITLIRVRGNSVRIGVDAPRDVRVVRGELEVFDSKEGGSPEFELSDREQAFAHPQPPIVDRQRPTVNDRSAAKTRRRQKMNNRLPTSERTETSQMDRATESHMFVGRVRPASDEIELTRAPLSGFVSAT